MCALVWNGVISKDIELGVWFGIGKKGYRGMIRHEMVHLFTHGVNLWTVFDEAV